MDTDHWFCRVGIILSIHLFITETLMTMRQDVLTIEDVSVVDRFYENKVDE